MSSFVELNRVQTDETAMRRLSRIELSVYLRWRNGASRHDLGPRSTFYRHRSSILALLGVDIVMKPDQQGL
jgi:hypothetical protein